MRFFGSEVPEMHTVCRIAKEKARRGEAAGPASGTGSVT